MSEKLYTSEQIRVIEHDGAHAVVAAVAGSGKTETLIGRVRHLMREISPDRIAVVMFNRDASEAFRRRFELAVKGPAPEIRTFNSMGNKIVNRFVQLGLLPDAKIVEKDYRRSKMAKDAFTHVFKKLEGDDAAPDKELVDAFIAFVLLVKCDTRSVEEIFEERRYGKSADGFPQAFKLFEEERKRQKLRFFEDQIYDPVKLMLSRIETQKAVANRIDHLIVDEAQDMNAIQIALLRILAGTRAKVMLVGDEDQAIYDWRGAKPDYLTRGFEKDFPDAVRYTLPHTFRFGHVLSLAASQLITHNANRNPKICISANGTPSTRVHCVGLALGLTGLGDRIKEAIENGAQVNDVAVLLRTYSMSVSLELELYNHRIPHYVYGRPPLIRIPEVSALVGLLQLASGQLKSSPEEEIRFAIGSLLRRPTLYLEKSTTSLLVDEVLRNPDRVSDAIRSVITPTTKPYHADLIRDRADLLEIIATSTPSDEKAVEVIDRYLRATNFERSIEKEAATGEQSAAILANVAAFRLIAQRHAGSIKEFLDEIDPLIDASNVEPPDEPHVWIGSIHRAKGAQWPHVFVPGLAARSFPREDLEIEQHEAERRLFYVAVTRAMEDLYLVHPTDSDFHDASENIQSERVRTPLNPVSSFLWEMDLAIAKHAGMAIESKGPFKSVPLVRPGVANAYFKRFSFASDWSYERREIKSAPIEMAHPGQREMPPGARVVHPVFGSGSIDRWTDDRLVRVVFDSGDSRLLVAALAKLQLQHAFQSNPVQLEDDDIPY